MVSHPTMIAALLLFRVFAQTPRHVHGFVQVTPGTSPSVDLGTSRASQSPNGRPVPPRTALSLWSTKRNLSPRSGNGNEKKGSINKRKTAAPRQPAPPERKTKDSERGDVSTNPESMGPDTHVLVPVKDVIPVALADMSQAAADSLGGGQAVHVSIERFCRTLESVCRTEFSMKVDEVDAGSVLGGPQFGRKPTGAVKRGGKIMAKPSLPMSPLRSYEQDTSDILEDDNRKMSKDDTFSMENNKGDSSQNGKLRLEFMRKIRRKQRNTDGFRGQEGNDINGARSWSRKLEKGVKWKKRVGDERETAKEEESVPLLKLVDELVKNGMYSPISERDIMMSQALAAEFPNAALVRPVYDNLAKVYDLLRVRRRSGKSTASAGKDKGEEKGGDNTHVPFEGRMLVFRRGNGVEETTGRLVLKKLDYLQSNAVGWLSQSLMDTVTDWQEKMVTVVDSTVRDFSKRKEVFLRGCMGAAIEFGFERDALVQFLPVANETELALQDHKAVDEALGAFRSNARRRGTVNLQRYGIRNANFNLEEFSECGSWPPGDDSWFWETGEGIGLEERGGHDGPLSSGRKGPSGEKEVPSTVLPRITLASVLGPPSERLDTIPRTRRGRSSRDIESKSILSRLFSRCTVREPTYDEVVVVYYKKIRRSRFRPPPALALLWKIGRSLRGNIRGIRGVDLVDVDVEPHPQDQAPKEAKEAGLGLQLRVYRGVPVVTLNAMTPDRKVVVRPQTALRLDLNTVVGLALVIANLRFDSLVLVVAATASVVLLVVRTIVGYLNAKIRVESVVSREILDKTMGSNVPVLRHLAEEAAQQKSRHVVLVYAALLQCALDESNSSSLHAVSMATVSRHCDALMNACIGLPWEAKIDVPHWLRELENLKVLLRVDPGGNGEHGPDGHPRCLLLTLEGSDNSVAQAKVAISGLETSGETNMRGEESTLEASISSETLASDAGAVDEGSSVVVYHLLDPDAAADELTKRWSELVEPPGGGERVAVDATPWSRKL